MEEITEEVKSLAIMAHDLKAPLSAVVNLLSIIEKGYVDDANKVKELIGRARHKSETMIRMVEDILDYTQLENKTMMKREKVNIYAVLEESFSTMRAIAKEKNITLTAKFDAPPHQQAYVFGNFTFLLRAFNNIIMNGIKYNRDQGKVEVQCHEDEEHTFTVKVVDTGIGVSDEDKEHAFDLFHRGREARKNIDGSIGLGLALVKQIIDDHEGSIDLTSTLGVGTTILIKLPLINKED
jgi:two-component system phosphate regulon sensor histidine kinase PhoR